MKIIFIILAFIAAVYLYAALTFHYGFKNWAPFCGCEGGVCGSRKPAVK